MLYLEAERMTNGLYMPADIDSERTVIISELQGGENDPEQLLDTEVTATAFRSHPYRHPTIGWLEDLQTISATTCISTTGTTTSPTTPPWSSSATSSWTMCCAGSSSVSDRSRPA